MIHQKIVGWGSCRANLMKRTIQSPLIKDPHSESCKSVALAQAHSRES